MGAPPKHVYVVGSFAFVPFYNGLWIRTDICVTLVPCPVCKAKKNQACFNNDKHIAWSGTHWQRRKAARGMRKTASAIIIRTKP